MMLIAERPPSRGIPQAHHGPAYPLRYVCSAAAAVRGLPWASSRRWSEDRHAARWRLRAAFSRPCAAASGFALIRPQQGQRLRLAHLRLVESSLSCSSFATRAITRAIASCARGERSACPSAASPRPLAVALRIMSRLERAGKPRSKPCTACTLAASLRVVLQRLEMRSCEAARAPLGVVKHPHEVFRHRIERIEKRRSARENH